MSVPNANDKPVPADNKADAEKKKAPTAEASNSPKVQFSRETFSARSRVFITVLLTGTCSGEARVTVAAKNGSGANGNFVTPKEIVFTDGETVETFSVPVGPNLSDESQEIDLELISPHNAQLGEIKEAKLIVRPSPGWWAYLQSVAKGMANDAHTGRVARHIILGVILILSVMGTDNLVARYADHQRDQWIGYLTPPTALDLVFPKDTLIKDYEQSRLVGQLKLIRDKENFHLRLMEFYYKGYYMGIVILSITGALAAITLVLISKKGWAATSEYIITTFFIMTCAALFYGSWAGLFKQEENITTNKVLYLKYKALENELFSYVTTGEALRYSVSGDDLKAAAGPTPSPSPSGSPATNKKATVAAPNNNKQPHQPDPDKTIGIPLTASVFIHYVDLQLAQDNIAIGFDYNQIPNYKNAFSNIGNTK